MADAFDAAMGQPSDTEAAVTLPADATDDEVENLEEAEVVDEVVRRMTVSRDGVDVPAVAIKKGQLMKRGEIRQSWKSRWFLLYDLTSTVSYLDKEEGNVKGGILLDEANMVRDATAKESGKQDQGHCLVIELPHRHYVICAPTLEDKSAWQGAIAKILVGLGKDSAAESQPAVPNRKRVKMANCVSNNTGAMAKGARMAAKVGAPLLNHVPVVGPLLGAGAKAAAKSHPKHKGRKSTEATMDALQKGKREKRGATQLAEGLAGMKLPS